MKKTGKKKKSEKTSKSLKNFEDSDSSPDFIINRKPDRIKKEVKDQQQLTSDSISLQTMSPWIEKYQ